MLQRMILATKLLPPKPRKDTVLRHRLLDPIRDNLGKRFTMVCAAAGYGKTTLIASLAATLGEKYIWYNLGTDDRDLGVFIAHLVYGIRQHHARFGARTQAALDLGNPAQNVNLVARTFINDLFKTIPDDFYFIFDDYHHVESAKPVNRLLEHLIEYLPPNIHLIVSSRNYPPFSLARLRSRGEVFELHTPELKFTLEEAQSAYQGRVPAARLRNAWDYFEGWITGIQFFLHFLKPEPGTDPGRSEEHMFNYFASEILNQQAPRFRSFLTRSSVLEVLTPKACDAVLKQSKSAAVLDYLVRNNLFVDELKNKKKYYKYHRFFKEFLLANLRETDPEQFVTLNQRAARYCLRRNDIASAVNHFLAAGDQANAAATIIKHYRRDIITRGWSGYLAPWLARISPALQQSQPWLLYIKGSVLMDEGKWDEALSTFQDTLSKFAARKERLGQSVSSYRLLVLFKRHGQVERARALGRSALVLCPPNEKELKALIINSLCALDIAQGRYAGVARRLNRALALVQNRHKRPEAIIVTNLGLVSQITGDFAKATASYERALKLGEQVVLSGMSIIYNNLATTRMLTGQFDHARRLLTQSMTAAQSYGEQRALLTTLTAWSELHLMEQDLSGFDESIARAQEMNLVMKDKEIEPLINLLLGKRHLQAGNHSLARSLFEKAARAGVAGFIGAQAHYGLAQISMQTGHRRQARSWLESSLSLSEKSGLKYFTAVALIGLAFFHYRRGKRRSWTGYLNRALALAQQNGYDYLLESSCRSLRHPGVPPRGLRPGGDTVVSGMVEMFFDGLKTCSRGDYLRQIISKCDAGSSVKLMQSSDNVVRTAARRVYDSLAANYRHHLRLTTQGQLKVYLPGGQEFAVHWYAQKHKMLFEFLATHPGWHAREKLVEHVWPGSAARTGFQNLRSAVARINQAFPFLPKLIARMMHSYGIAQSHRIVVDYLEFQDLVQEVQQLEKSDESAACEKLKAAVGLAPIGFLEDNYASWAQECRESVHSMLSAALAKLVDHYLRTSAVLEAIECANRLVRHEPFVEKYYQLLFKAYAMAGDRPSVEAEYGRMCELFHKELQREPSVETTTLYAKLTGPPQTS